MIAANGVDIRCVHAAAKLFEDLRDDVIGDERVSPRYQHRLMGAMNAQP